MEKQRRRGNGHTSSVMTMDFRALKGGRSNQCSRDLHSLVGQTAAPFASRVSIPPATHISPSYRQLSLTVQHLSSPSTIDYPLFGGPFSCASLFPNSTIAPLPLFFQIHSSHPTSYAILIGAPLFSPTTPLQCTEVRSTPSPLAGGVLAWRRPSQH